MMTALRGQNQSTTESISGQGSEESEECFGDDSCEETRAKICTYILSRHIDERRSATL